VKRLFLIGALIPCCVAFPQERDYRDELTARFPFYQTARTVFAPVYPALARQLVQDYGISKGVAVDLGGADGSLAIELAKITDLKIYSVDIDPAAVRLCHMIVDRNQLTGRVLAVEADAADLPLRDGLADLVVSRNSLFQWPDLMAGLREAYRILKPGGVAYMGGGFSRLLEPGELRRLIEWSEDKLRRKPDSMLAMPKDLAARLSAEGMTQVRIIEGPSRFDWWLEMRKPEADAGPELSAPNAANAPGQ
jgi:SAM-dependent methyltransferase